ncbi:MAG: hypothetical protein IKG35_11015 [Erysipelotrichaceae bacterium]|nr:hypothetical protein [Erysipelotrichaceae bacterium]
MKKLFLMLLTITMLFSLSGTIVKAAEVTTPEEPIASDRSETRDVYVIGTQNLNYTGLTGNIKFLTTGTATKNIDAWGNITYSYSLNTSLYSYTVTSGTGYPTYSGVTYYVSPSHHLMAKASAVWHGGTQNGTTIYCVYTLY